MRPMASLRCIDLPVINQVEASVGDGKRLLARRLDDVDGSECRHRCRSKRKDGTRCDEACASIRSGLRINERILAWIDNRLGKQPGEELREELWEELQGSPCPISNVARRVRMFRLRQRFGPFVPVLCANVWMISEIHS